MAKDGSAFPSWKKATSDEPKKKSSSTSNKPKRPLTAFLIFMNDFRKTYEEKNPYINVQDLAKHGAEKWKSLTEKKKNVYLDKAAKLKEDYNKSLEDNDANDKEEDQEKQSNDVDDAEEMEVEIIDDENKYAEGKEEEEVILEDY